MIHGIQHIGIGVVDFEKSWDFYKSVLHFNVPLSRDRSVAARMGSLTNGVHERQVVIALNLLGGGLVEVFKFTSKDPAASPPLTWHRPGLLSFALKVIDMQAAHEELRAAGVQVLAPPSAMTATDEQDWQQMFFEDPEGNILSLVQAPQTSFSLRRKGANIGGILFPTIGVTDMTRSLPFYRDILGYSETIYDWQGQDSKLAAIPGADGALRRVLLSRNQESTSLFRFYLDGGMIELIETDATDQRHLYADRGWGDQGIMELCFDVNRIQDTYQDLLDKGAPPVIAPEDEDFDMGGGSAGLFAYVHDPDGTWIELAEIISFNIFLGLKFDLRKRSSNRPLPAMLLKLLRFASSS